jgi:hypothetical protein
MRATPAGGRVLVGESDTAPRLAQSRIGTIAMSPMLSPVRRRSLDGSDRQL